MDELQYRPAIAEDTQRAPPPTRYQGSKYKLLPWIGEQLGGLRFETALDAFGGSASVSYLLKALGKQVVYNDQLEFNRLIGLALVENQRVTLSRRDIDALLQRRAGFAYDDLIERTFDGIYFQTDENRQLDAICQNILSLRGRYKRALAWYALFQAALIKRPYNLFHRKNLYMRSAQVKRGFGNKAAWDRPLESHFRHFAVAANRAVFDSGAPCRAICGDAAAAPGSYDLVYIDPPYISKKGSGVDYRDFYHFLEGMVNYPRWEEKIDRQRRHLPLVREASPWNDARQIHDAFRKVFERFAESVLVVSYRSDGIPSDVELADLLRSVKRNVRRVEYGEYKYVLSTNRRSREILLIGE